MEPATDEHGGTRTPDIQNRNLTLYPTELHAQIPMDRQLMSGVSHGLASRWSGRLQAVPAAVLP